MNKLSFYLIGNTLMINGDNVEGYWEKFLYFPQCCLNYFDHEKNVKCEFWEDIDSDLVNLGTGTPSRILCDSFWRSINYESLSLQFGKQLHFFDLGAGSGAYAGFFETLSGKRFGSYTGLDVYQNIDFPKKHKLILSDANHASEYLRPQNNFIVSQSALEHIENDTASLISVTKSLSQKSKNFIQVHMIPAPASLPLYLWHGWRQYSLRNLSRWSSLITAIDDNLEMEVFALGGIHSFWTHFKHYTVPDLFMKNRNSINLQDEIELRQSKSQQAVLKDLKSRNILLNTFWAVVIKPKHIQFSSLND